MFAGVAHVTGIILCIIRIILSRQSKGAEKYRLNSTARFVHVCAAIAAAANLLLVLFLLNGRIAADTILVVHGHVAPFEWVGECSTNPDALLQTHVQVCMQLPLLCSKFLCPAMLLSAPTCMVGTEYTTVQDVTCVQVWCATSVKFQALTTLRMRDSQAQIMIFNPKHAWSDISKVIQYTACCSHNSKVHSWA